MIGSELYIDKSEKGTKLLAKQLLDIIQIKKKAPAREPKPRDRPQKNPIEVCIKTPIEPEIVSEKEVVMSITETISKIYELESYNKAINNPVYDRRQREVIKEELQNLESHQTWKYKKLPLGQKAIKSKWIFKVKYHSDGSVARFKTRLVAQRF